MKVPCYLLGLILSTAVSAAPNLCPNPDLEAGQEGQPTGWLTDQPGTSWATDEVHSGQHSLKITWETAGPTISWTSEMIPVTHGGQQFALSLWAKLEQVGGRNGAFCGFYHTDAAGQRIGQSGGMTIGGAGPTAETKPWAKYLTVSNLTPEVKGVQVNVRLYGATGTAWFDDFAVVEMRQDPLTQPVPLRRGLAKDVAIVGCSGGDAAAKQLHDALTELGLDAPVLDPRQVDLETAGRDLLVLGNLVDSPASEYLYLRSYTSEDRYYPGAGGYVLRPLVNPLGNGRNLLVVGASDEAGLKAAVAELVELLKPDLNVPLTIKLGEGYRGLRTYPWGGSGPRRELEPAMQYLVLGDREAAKRYHDEMLKLWLVSDDNLFNRDNQLHLFYESTTLSWDLMYASEAFTDAERLQLTNQLLKVLRSDQGYGYAGLRAGRLSRENHATRAATGFYYGWRHFRKYYPETLSYELDLWRERLKGFWTSCFESSRSYEDSLSQHALGGSLVGYLDIGFQEPEWSKEFFESGRARQMGERCLAIVNNLGQTVLLGDTGGSDYPASPFAMLAWKLQDGRYKFMLEHRGGLGCSTDEPVRGFVDDLPPAMPTDHVGLKVIPADRVYFDTALHQKEGVEFDRAFDKLTFRSGFGRADEYLLLDGVAGGSHSYDDANSIGEYAANGRRWLCEIDIFNGPTMAFHNAVTVARDGLGAPAPPQAAELVRQATGDGYVYTATRLPRHHGVDWTRHLLWLPNRYLAALDELTAYEPGNYSFVLGWRSLGSPKLTAGRFSSAQDETPHAAMSWSGQALTAAVTGSSGKALRCLEGYDALFYRADVPGDWVTVGLDVETAGTYRLEATVLDYTGRGRLQLSWDGQPLGDPIELFGGGPAQRHQVDLGERRLSAGRHELKLVVPGKNAASDGYTIALCELNAYQPDEQQRAAAQAANRFTLCFPPETPATLDRDNETLGNYLPPNKYADAALNIVEQSRSATLAVDQSSCFQNVFYAAAGKVEQPGRLRRLSEQVALLERDGEPAVVGAALHGTELRLGPVTASGKLFYLSPSLVILDEATARLNGQELAAGQPSADRAKALREALTAAWAAPPPASTATPPAWSKLPDTPAVWSVDLPALPRSVTIARAKQGTRLVAGLESGAALAFDAEGRPQGTLQTQGPVQALAACDLDGDEAEEVVAGSDDETLTATDGDLKQLWQQHLPFLPKEQPWSWWTLGSAKVRQIYTTDLTGDGRPEIYLGVGNMRLHALDATGRELWRYRTDHGICTTITSAVLGGQRRLLAGNGLTSSNGTCWILDAKGKVVGTRSNEGWCTSLPAIAVGDLDGDGQPTIFCGNNRGNLRAFPPSGAREPELWVRNFTRPIRSLTILPRCTGAVLVVGSDSGYLCALDQAGETVWGVPLSSAITHTAAVGDRLFVGCRDGQVFCLDPDGRLLSRSVLAGRLRDLEVRQVSDRITLAAVVSDPNRLVRLSQLAR